MANSVSASEIEMLVASLHILFERLADEFNKSVAEEPLFVTTERVDSEDLRRLIVSSSFWALSLRGKNNTAEFFLLPAIELPQLQESELPSRLKLTLVLDDAASWSMNGTPVSADELNALMRGLFKDLVTRSQHDFNQLPESARLVASTQSFAGSVRSLVADKHALLQKIVDQQEAIQSQLARELHDSVLGNIMLLRRSLSGSASKRMSDEAVVDLLDEICLRLREISHELSPRDLLDCGLRPMLQELCRDVERFGCRARFHAPDSLPEFPKEVAMQLFRITQECFNNVVKHSGATEVELLVTIEGNLFRMCIADNGKGFDTSREVRGTKYGGTGLGIIRERVELINSLFPARVSFTSQPNGGTRTTVELTTA